MVTATDKLYFKRRVFCLFEFVSFLEYSIMFLLSISISFSFNSFFCSPSSNSLIEMSRISLIGTNKEISGHHHNTPYYCDFSHINKNSTNCLSRY